MTERKWAFAGEPITFLFKKMWRFSKGNRSRVVAFVVLFAFSNAILLLGPLVFAWFINEVQADGVTYDNIVKLTLILSLSIVIELFFWIFHSTARILERNNALFVRIQYREYLLKGSLNLGMQWHSDRDSGNTLDKMQRAAGSLRSFSSSLFRLFKILFGITGSVIALYFFNAYISIGVLIAILGALYILSRFDKVLVAKQRIINKMENTISAAIFDVVSNVTTVLILNIQKPVMRRLRKLFRTPVGRFAEQTKLNEMKWSLGSVMFEVIKLVPFIFFLVYELQKGSVIALGTLTALYMYLDRMGNGFFSFGNLYEDLLFWKANVENASEIEDAIETAQNVKSAELHKNWNIMHVHNLNFSYNDIAPGKSKHLNAVAFDVQKGERVAFIGESGSGKTTLLKVLHGLYDSAHATISFDETKEIHTNFQEFSLGSMLVPQEPEVFSSTIKENITLGLPYNASAIDDVLEMAQLNDVIAQLPKGLKSVVNEKGVNLSGGQKQRLALARALLFAQDKEFILLDESTSSVDPENEQHIYQNIFKAFKDKTIFASIHKMNLLKYFDRIIIFKHGKISDEGTFNELLERNKEFEKSWKNFVEQSH